MNNELVSTSERIYTERCLLRYPSEKDITHVWSATRVDGFNDGMAWDPPEHIEELLEPQQKSEANWRAGTSYAWTVINRHNEEFVGRIAIRRAAPEDVWSIGFWTHPVQQRQGYAKEAAEAVIQFGFQRLHAKSITAAHATWNEASGKVLVAVGMRFVRTNPRGFQKRGQWVEEHEYEIVQARFA